MHPEDDERIKDLRGKAMHLPMNPGVYLMRDRKNQIIYIGKAKLLKNRVSQYFGSNKNHGSKVRKMVENVDHFEYIVTDSEFEALILENSLIKQNQPKFNILLKDDKGFSYIRISNDEWPRFSEVKKVQEDGAKYIGPYMSIWAVKEAVDSACRIFKLPTCSRRFPEDFGKARPCLNFYIKQCDAPCSGKVKHKQYMENFTEAMDFIKGGPASSVKALHDRMEEAAQRLDFETAARLRDRIASINRMKENQKVVASNLEEQDIIAMTQGEQNISFEVFRFTGHKLTDRESFLTQGCANEAESRSEFIYQYYAIRDRVPPVIVIDGEVEDEELITRWLKEKRNKTVKLFIPQRGEQFQLMQMCKKNSAETLASHTGNSGKEASALDEIKRLLGLEKIPVYIESYDISNLAGGDNVAGMVVFENGRPLKKAYRKFKIKSFDGQDDYNSMREVIQRRFEEYKKNPDGEPGFGKLPDLILLDGGKGQVNAVIPILEQMGIKVPVYGMVKDDKHKTRAIAVSGGEIAINSNRSAFTLISKIQDEVHRFAIGYHHQHRKKSAISSTLLSIEGVGPSRAKALLKHFRTVDAVSKSSIKELESVKGINKDVAVNVYRYFNSEEA